MTSKPARGGKMPPGWIKQGLQVPKHVADDFKQHADELGAGGVKLLGTVAIDLVNHLPEHFKKELALAVYQTTWPDPAMHSSRVVWIKFLVLMLREINPPGRMSIFDINAADIEAYEASVEYIAGDLAELTDQEHEELAREMAEEDKIPDPRYRGISARDDVIGKPNSGGEQ